jgi:hypothetical protein
MTNAGAIYYYIADQQLEVTDARSVVHGLCKDDSLISDSEVVGVGLRPVSQAEYEAHALEMALRSKEMSDAYEEAEARCWDDDY